MSISKWFSRIGVGVLVVSFGLGLGSCTSKITEEQLMTLKELRKEERNLSEQIRKKQDEKSKLEAEIKARKGDLKKCQDEVDFIKQKLALWPDIWPDWKPGEGVK